MKTRLSRVYRHHHKKPAQTFVKSKQTKTFKGLPNKRLINYEQGNTSVDKFAFKECFKVTVNETVLLTEMCLESFRVTLTRLLLKTYTKASWYYVLCKHTHIILRKHKLPTGGHVDRVSMGMRLAYGSPFARAAKINAGDTLLNIYYNPLICKKGIIKKFISKANCKLPTTINFINLLCKK
jgi:large subunit ribosomal protein L10e